MRWINILVKLAKGLTRKQFIRYRIHKVSRSIQGRERRKMEQNSIVIMALAAGGKNAEYGPAQAQKLFFLIDKELNDLPDAPFFAFQPYDYGPFDKDVYSALDSLKESGRVLVNHSSRYRKFALTEEGYQEGEKLLQEMSGHAKKFITDAAIWVQETSFQDMVSAIYTKYPDMKANSIFRS